ncbi:MAG: UDP-N-acetylmuramoyl-tripeptide--D-alanyl-D-alanine ligase [Armatimonadota bacterium]
MEDLFIREVVQAIDGLLVSGNPESVVTGVSIDTRSLKQGDLFFALKGENSDGHKFIEAAINAGAGGLIVSDKNAVPVGCKSIVIQVDDPLWALGDLAKYYRSKFDVKVVGITGSVGKTMTKEMLASILERKWTVLKNVMNFNNEIGVPLTLLQLNHSHQVVVLEMAMRGLEEIRRLASIAQPSVGVITNIGLSHIERLGSQGSIADAKSELLSELPADGVAVLNAEDCYFTVLKNRYAGKIISFGSCSDADVAGARIKLIDHGCFQFVVSVGEGAIEVNMPVLGQHNVYNALAASAAAYGMGVALPDIKVGLENFTQPAMRMELIKSRAGYAVLNDCYNASPTSMTAALRTLNTITGYKRKIAVLGDMLELGDYARKAHYDIGRLLDQNDVESLITVGELAKHIAEGAVDAGFPSDAVCSYPNSRDAASVLKGCITDGDAVLVKGSRGMHMEEIVRVLLND